MGIYRRGKRGEFSSNLKRRVCRQIEVEMIPALEKSRWSSLILEVIKKSNMDNRFFNMNLAGKLLDIGVYVIYCTQFYGANRIRFWAR